MKAVLCKLWIICLFLPLIEVQAKVYLPSIWGDNMVLQQQSEVFFQGKAVPNKEITIEVSWDRHKISTISDEYGNWKAKVFTPTAGGPYSIRFSDGEEFILNNILIGEVWFCSGQSNMEMPVRGFRGQPVYGSQSHIVSADRTRHLRLFTVKRDWSTSAKENVTGSWIELSPKEVGDFSAVAYFFGDLLQRSLDVPVGLIHSSWSASKIEAWIDRNTLLHFSEVRLPDQTQTEFEWPAGTPTLLWNAMVHPWKGFSVKGVIWYQGEANSSAPQLYRKLFPAMVNQWRLFFQNPDMPFYYVQIAPWQSDGKDNFGWAWFRQCQLELMAEVSNVGMVTTTDVGSEKFIHPPHKIKVGERLAYWALAKTYGHEGFLYSGPLYKSHILKGNVVEITFEHGSQGLIPENQCLKGFEIVDNYGKILPAKAEVINGSARVKVWNDSVSQPTEVRYCFRNYMEGNLCNNAELPASPFRIVVQSKK
ncbi:sialate O-acetylesterase [Bacteroides pyogenes]|uniref:sialate O-acetylesterase n=1 Tax=Bacteroides pyogenes TaxID=310300 RepID=UPI0011E466FC|nr:sialate O-acetylesterase [Bacteroides pyogenes]TYK37036.1 sialate O-acetylesterase [Bacteroides pyogenes]